MAEDEYEINITRIRITRLEEISMRKENMKGLRLRLLTLSFWATYLFRCLVPGRSATLPKIQNARSGIGLAQISTERESGCPE